MINTPDGLSGKSYHAETFAYLYLTVALSNFYSFFLHRQPWVLGVLTAAVIHLYTPYLCLFYYHQV